MTCYLCGGTTFIKRMGFCRDNPYVYPLECNDCGLVFLSQRLAVDYQNTVLHEIELNDDDKRRAEFTADLIKNKSLLDFGCGNANYLWHYARLTAKEVAGVEPCLQVTERPGVLIYRSLAEIDRKFDVITMFHSIEHLLHPRAVLIELKKKLNPGGKLIIETPNSNDALLTLYKCKEFADFTYWTCHPFLFNADTLGLIGDQAGFNRCLLQHVQRYPLSNHLYWLAEGKPGGHKIWGCLDNPQYEKILCGVGISDTVIGIFE